MKIKIVLLVFFVLLAFALFAQTSEITSYKLNWKGIEKWVAGSATIKVISFDSANYPTENRLPYFNQRMSYDRNLSFQVELVNPVYVPLTGEEN